MQNYKNLNVCGHAGASNRQQSELDERTYSIPVG